MTEVNTASATMRLIEFDDLQLVRYWRNLDHVRKRMVMKNLIGRDGQREWYDGIDSDTDHYFIYSLGTRDIGCVNLKSISVDERTFEGGIFCGDAQYLSHWVNIWACLRMYDYGFFELNLDTSYATILADNKAALNLNKSLGYEFIEHADVNVGRYALSRRQYEGNSERIRRYLHSFVQQSI